MVVSKWLGVIFATYKQKTATEKDWNDALYVCIVV